MPETPPDLNSETRQDPELAQHVAYAEEPYRAGAERARELGEAAAAVSIQGMQDEAGLGARNKYYFDKSQDEETLQDIEAQDPVLAQDSSPAGETSDKPGPSEDWDDSSAETPADSEISDQDREQIKRWLTDGLSVVHTWVGRNRMDKRHNPNGQNSFMTLFSEHTRSKRLLKEVKETMSPGVQKAFDQQGISEVAEILGLGKPFSDVDKDSPKGAEDTIMISYYTGLGGDRKEGNFTKMKLFLPESEAAEVQRVLETNPRLFREMTEVFMEDVVQAGDSWFRPPNYEAMAAKNSGVNRIAISEGQRARPDGSRVVEF